MRNTMRAGLAAAAVLSGLAISTLTGAGPSGAAPPQHATARQARFPVPAGHRFAVLLDDSAAVIDMATGRVLRTVRPPDPGSEFLWVAAAARGRMFVLASRPRSGWLRFSVLRVSRDGQTVSLRPVPLQRRLAGQLTGLAVSPDGTRFAVSVWQLAAGEPAWLWEGRLPRPGQGRLWVSRAGTAVNPSWAGDRRLAFGWWPGRHGQPGLRIRGLTGGTPGTPASPLAGARMIAPGISRSSSQITADGSAVLSVVVARDGQARLDELAPRIRPRAPLLPASRPSQTTGQAGLRGALDKPQRPPDHHAVRPSPAPDNRQPRTANPPGASRAVSRLRRHEHLRLVSQIEEGATRPISRRGPDAAGPRPRPGASARPARPPSRSGPCRAAGR